MEGYRRLETPASGLPHRGVRGLDDPTRPVTGQVQRKRETAGHPAVVRSDTSQVDGAGKLHDSSEVTVNPAEKSRMFELEDRYWWFVSRR
jgi:hypothetical protein